MSEIYTIALSKLCEEFNLEKVYVPTDFDNILVDTPQVSRPGLALAGFFEIFDAERIQIIGNAERHYLESLSSDERKERIFNYINARPVAVIYSTGAEVFPEMLEAAQGAGVDSQAVLGLGGLLHDGRGLAAEIC